MATFRYLVKDVDPSIKFYELLGFELRQQFGPAMAILSKDDMILWLAGPVASAAQAMPDGTKPVPGGWSRFVLPVKDIEAKVSELSAQGLKFRNTILRGPGGAQILVEDPSGNVVELFQAL